MKEKTLSLTKKLMSTTRRKFSKEFKAKVVLESLKEGETLECYKKIFSQIKYSSVKIVSILGGDIFKYKDLNRFLESIKRYNLDSHLWVNYLNIPEEVYLLSSDVFYNILVTFPIRKNSIERILERCKTNLKLHFLIENESQYSYSINMINQFKIEKYNIIPIYIGRNKKIFSENIFLTRSNIFSKRISMREIFRNQKLNANYFGTLVILPDGSARANINTKEIGNVKEDSILKLIYKELTENSAWRVIRNNKVCNNCLYRFLCPPPSSYETVIGKPNLCHINHK